MATPTDRSGIRAVRYHPHAAPLQYASGWDRQIVSSPERPAVSRRRSFDCCCGALNRAAHRRSIRRCSSRGILGCSSIASSWGTIAFGCCDRFHVAGLGRWDSDQKQILCRSFVPSPIPMDRSRNVVVEVRLTLCAGNSPPVNCRRGPAAGVAKTSRSPRRGTERSASDSTIVQKPCFIRRCWQTETVAA